MRKVILINPPYQEAISSVSQISVGPPLGLAYIASMLIKQGIKVNILDANALKFGVKEIIRWVDNTKPDIVGLTATTSTINICKRIADGIKSFAWKVPIVVGGIHPSTLPRETLEDFRGFDYVVEGEGEYTFSELISELNKPSGKNKQPCFKKIKGLAYRNKNKIHVNDKRQLIENLDNIPFPARHLLPNHLYRSVEYSNFTTIIAMRGCPAKCIYCSVPSFCGNRLRKRSPQNVIDELKECFMKYGVKSFSFLDDTFTYDKQWVMDFCRMMVKTGLNKKMTWLCLTRVDNVDDELMKMLKKAGCYKIELGIESGSQEILRRIGKNISIPQIRKAFAIAKRNKMKTMAFAIIGFPFETRKDILMTKKLLMRIKPDFLQISYATPYPGTPFYEYCMKRRLIMANGWSDYVFLKKSRVRNEKNLSTKDILLLKKYIERSFYLRPSYMIQTIFYLITRTNSLKLVFERMLGFLKKI